MSFDFKKFADKIENTLKGHCHAYAFVVSLQDDWKEKREYGWARTNNDAPALKMSTSVPFHIASVSKTITAAALLKILNQRKDVNADMDFHPWLPEHWDIHADMRNVSFKQLLTHQSGFNTAGIDYHSLKQSMKAGIVIKPEKAYQGINFALMRFLIPALAGYNIPQKNKPDIVFEMKQAANYAEAYMDYVQKEIFDKAGLPKLHCKAIPYITGKGYNFPELGHHGDDFGDHTLTCGSGGWVMNAAQMAKFFRQLDHTTNVIPAHISKMMHDNLMGYDGDSGKTPRGMRYVYKGGIYYNSSDQKVKTAIVGFDNNIQVALIVNSVIKGTTGGLDTIVNAFDKTWVKLVLKEDK